MDPALSRALTLAALLGCGDGSGATHPRPQPTDTAQSTESSDDTATTPVVDTSTAPGDTGTDPDPDVRITPLGVVPCPEPDARASARFRRRELGPPNAVWRDLTASGMVLADFDGDGRLEWFAPTEQGALFLERRPDGTWAALPALDAPLDDTVGGSAADFDGDGDLDLFLTRLHQTDVLLRNDGGTFTDVTDQAGVGGSDKAPSVSGSWGDYDGDGDLDLAVGVYGANIRERGWRPHPSYLYRNEGDGTFTDQSAQLPSEVHEGYNFLNAWQDIDGDLVPELLVLNDFHQEQGTVLLRYDGERFRVDRPSGFHPGISSMGLGIGDVNDDLVPDLVETSFWVASLMKSYPAPDNPSGVMYVDHAQADGVIPLVDARHQIFGWGAELVDVDNDGDLDIPMVFGFWDAFPANDPRHPGRDPEDQHDALFLQDEDGQFTDVAGDAAWGVDDPLTGRGLLAVDVNGDGWIDLIKRILDGPDVIYEGVCGPEAWLEVGLRAPAPNTHAVGARVVVEAGGRRHVRWIGSGNTSMFSGGPPIAHFGLGDVDTVDRLEVSWPHDGVTHTFTDLASRQVIDITRVR